jgi:hypothetical protein
MNTDTQDDVANHTKPNKASQGMQLRHPQQTTVNIKSLHILWQSFLLFGTWFKYEIWTNLFKYYIYGNECVGISFHLNILNIMKNCQRIYGDYIFTMVCHVCNKQLPSKHHPKHFLKGGITVKAT